MTAKDLINSTIITNNIERTWQTPERQLILQAGLLHLVNYVAKKLTARVIAMSSLVNK
jgi:hypothetical protein